VVGNPTDDAGNDLADIADVQAQDDAEIYVAAPGIEVSKTPDVQYLLSGETANFTITITNTGDVTLTSITTVDPLATACVIASPGITLPAASLAPANVYSYTCSKTNVTADFTNIITATGTPSDDQGNPLALPDVSDDDDAFVDVFTPELTVTKVLNTTGTIYVGYPLSYTIYVTNTGEGWIAVLPLTDVYSTTYMSYGYQDPGTLTWTYADPMSDNTFNDGEVEWADLVASNGDTYLAPLAGYSVVVTFTAAADTTQTVPGGAITNTATITNAVVDADGPGDDADPDKPVPPAEDDEEVEIVTPTGVGLAGFQASAQLGGVLLSWQTAHEAQLMGFNILRDDGGSLATLNESLIFAQRAGSSQGATYRFSDNGALPGRTYSYVLEVVQTDGNVQRLDLGAVTARWWMKLPLIVR
jgi:uncharacterized repeat protein (TIGR01451 family)